MGSADPKNFKKCSRFSQLDSRTKSSHSLYMHTRNVEVDSSFVKRDGLSSLPTCTGFEHIS